MAAFFPFRSLVENSPDAISLIDPKGDILYASASTSKVFGYEPEELVGRNSLELLYFDDRVQMSRKLPELLQDPPVPLQWHARIRRKDGSLSWVESTACNMLRDPDVQAIAVNYRDINARKAAEAEERKDAAEQTRSRLVLEEFAYAVAHDLREPLRTISAFTELLVRRMPMDEESKLMAGFAVDASARMSALLNDLLLLATTGIIEPFQPVDLGEAVSQAKRNLGLSISESQATITAGPLPLVQGNQGHLVRVLQNLFSNALKYRGKDPPEIHVSATRLEGQWMIQVLDNGIGIAPEHQEQIFDLFKRLHGRDIPGSGIGLAFCRKIVETAGGRIWVESQPGAGATFCFTIAAAKRGDPRPLAMNSASN